MSESVGKKAPVVWFEIPVKDLERGKRFYESVLEVELRIQDFGHLQMAFFPDLEGGSGADGALVLAETYEPSYQGTMVYFGVEDIEATLGRVRAQGGKVITEKMSIGEFGFVGHFEDSEGNRVALHSER